MSRAPLPPPDRPAPDRLLPQAPEARIGPLCAALPPAVDQEALWADCFAGHYRDQPVAARLWRRAGVTRRHAAVDPRAEDLSRWTTGARMRRYVELAVPLARTAAAEALRSAGCTGGDVGLLVVVSCTGYATPGVDLLVAHDLGLAPAAQRLVIGHMGCYAALPALAAAADAVVARGLTALVVSVELPSLHVQPPTPDAGQLIAHALFSDAAVAAVVAPDQSAPGPRRRMSVRATDGAGRSGRADPGGGLVFVDTVAATDTAHLADMTWEVTDAGFRMGLSPRVPGVLARHVRPVTQALLARHGLALDDVGGWAVHPGGPRIVEVCGRALGLADAALAASRATLAEHGNCSSATVLLVLQHLVASGELAPGEPVVALAFGPGLTLYATLLRVAR